MQGQEKVPSRFRAPTCMDMGGLRLDFKKLGLSSAETAMVVTDSDQRILHHAVQGKAFPEPVGRKWTDFLPGSLEDYTVEVESGRAVYLESDVRFRDSTQRISMIHIPILDIDGASIPVKTKYATFTRMSETVPGGTLGLAPSFIPGPSQWPPLEECPGDLFDGFVLLGLLADFLEQKATLPAKRIYSCLIDDLCMEDIMVVSGMPYEENIASTAREFFEEYHEHVETTIQKSPDPPRDLGEQAVQTLNRIYITPEDPGAEKVPRPHEPERVLEDAILKRISDTILKMAEASYKEGVSPA